MFATMCRGKKRTETNRALERHSVAVLPLGAVRAGRRGAAYVPAGDRQGNVPTLGPLSSTQTSVPLI